MADFSYKKVKGNKLRPIIPIFVSSGKNGVQYEVLVDSGADCNVFDAEIGEAIGIDIKSGTPDQIKGVDGRGIDCWVHEVRVTVVGEGLVTVKTAFTYSLPLEGYGLVGQNGFFDHFIVRFDYNQGKVSVTKNNSPLVN
ncbi:MAG TPA: aspartyl protease family protein [Candidatus Nanoarchaeia archaeon]